MKKILKEIIFLLVMIFLVTNIINFIRAPKPNIQVNNIFPNNPEIIYFYTTWCKICKLEKPAIQEVEKSLKVVKVDATNKDELNQLFQIKGFPTIFYVIDGKIAYVDIGYTSSFTIKLKYYFLKFLNKLGII